jgi:hypothetical protein
MLNRCAPFCLQTIVVFLFFTFVRCRQFATRGLRPCTDHGRPMKPFFIKVSNYWAWAEKKNFGAFGLFSANVSGLILVSPSPCFLLINHYFYKKLSLYIHIPNIYLGLGFEFGPQRIRDLAIMCP